MQDRLIKRKSLFVDFYVEQGTKSIIEKPKLRKTWKKTLIFLHFFRILYLSPISGTKFALQSLILR